ncbi:hypothetical protein HK096_011419 [Nowakowskiella sp. JEL0078]|nr:hypothetical protein HK096_011419 [Nowakowskiella sp. JEL0078]
MLSVWVGTFNLGTWVPKDKDEVDISHWIRGPKNFPAKAPDVFVFGFQELLSQPANALQIPTNGYIEYYMGTQPRDTSILSAWFDIINSSLSQIYRGEEFEHVISRRLCALGMIVFTKKNKDKKWSLNLVRSGEIGLGLLGLYGNKGAIGIQLEFISTKKDSSGKSHPISLCFISSHLQAHEGAVFFEQRKDDATHLFENLKFDLVTDNTSLEEPDSEVLSSVGLSGHDAIWFFGDFNFRLRGKPLRQYVLDLIDSSDFEKIQSIDELKLVLQTRSHKYLRYFLEGKIEFAPSYKYSLDPLRLASEKLSDRYATSRLPAYCDRILISTTHQLVETSNVDMEPLTTISQEWYFCASKINYSDHKPVSSLFLLRQNSESAERKLTIRNELLDLRRRSAWSFWKIVFQRVFRFWINARIPIFVFALLFFIFIILCY